MSHFWQHLFVLSDDISILEKIVRPILVYVFLIIGLRLAGKRELAQLNPFDLIVLLTLSNTVQNAIIGDDNSVVAASSEPPRCWRSIILSCDSSTATSVWIISSKAPAMS